jgi:hypothetical protein
MAVRWASMLAPVAVVLAASGCLGGTAAATSPPIASSPTVRLQARPYAVFHIRGTYLTSRTNHFSGDIDRIRFTVACGSPRSYRGLFGRVPWRARLCMALLDYRMRVSPQRIACSCPVSVGVVDVRGTIRGRPIHERITPCLCGDGRRAAADARIILRTHPTTRPA